MQIYLGSISPQPCTYFTFMCFSRFMIIEPYATLVWIYCRWPAETDLRHHSCVIQWLLSQSQRNNARGQIHTTGKRVTLMPWSGYHFSRLVDTRDFSARMPPTSKRRGLVGRSSTPASVVRHLRMGYRPWRRMDSSARIARRGVREPQYSIGRHRRFLYFVQQPINTSTCEKKLGNDCDEKM